MNYNIEKLVSDFYHYISANKLDKAWELLSVNLKQRGWKNDFQNFEIGYTNTLALKGIHIWDIIIEDETATCNVFYTDRITTHTHKYLGNFDKLTVEDLQDYVDIMQKLIEKSASTKLTGFEKIELCKFFDPAVSEYIWYKCGMNPEAIKDLLPRETTMEIPRLYSLSCAYKDDVWLITSILPFEVFQLDKMCLSFSY